MVKRIEQCLTLNSLVLFGSYAKGEERQERFTKRFDVLRPLFGEVKLHPTYRKMRKEGFYPQFSPIPYRPEGLRETPPLLLDLVKDAGVIKDDGTFGRKMAELRKRLSELGAKRVATKKGNRYWILKPRVERGEVGGIPASRLFIQEDAEQALKYARKVIDLASRLFKEFYE